MPGSVVVVAAAAVVPIVVQSSTVLLVVVAVLVLSTISESARRSSKRVVVGVVLSTISESARRSSKSSSSSICTCTCIRTWDPVPWVRVCTASRREEESGRDRYRRRRGWVEASAKPRKTRRSAEPRIQRGTIPSVRYMPSLPCGRTLLYRYSCCAFIVIPLPYLLPP